MDSLNYSNLQHLFGKNQKIFQILAFLVKKNKEVNIQEIKNAMEYKENADYAYNHLEKLIKAGLVIKTGKRGNYLYKIRSKAILFQFINDA